MTHDPDRLLGSDYLAQLDQRPIEDVRALRAECLEVETGLSYLRRMVQGPLDIVRRELSHRAEGGHSGLAQLLDELPEVLADGPRAQGSGRLPQSLAPTALDPDFAAEVDSMVGDGRLVHIADLGDDELRALAVGLADLERRISDRRREFFVQLDHLQAELTRRYADGEANVDTLLAGE